MPPDAQAIRAEPEPTASSPHPLPSQPEPGMRAALMRLKPEWLTAIAIGLALPIVAMILFLVLRD